MEKARGELGRGSPVGGRGPDGLVPGGLLAGSHHRAGGLPWEGMGC